MRNNLKTAFAVLASVFMAGATIAEAVDVQIGGELRPRYEVNQQSDFNSATKADQFFSTRARLDANAKINDDTSAFIQLQSVRTWGADTGTTPAANTFTAAGTAGAPMTGGTGNAGLTANDTDTSVGLHQAYFTIKNFFTLPVDLKLGRQEIALDDHRIFGNANWFQGARAHDAVILSRTVGNNTVLYAYSKAGTPGRGLASGDVNNDFNVDAHLLWANLKDLVHSNSGTSLYFVAVVDSGNTTAASCTGCAVQSVNANTSATTAGTTVSNSLVAKNNIYTYGFRQEGMAVPALWGIDYLGEFFYQNGSAESDAATAFRSGLTSATGNYYNGRTAPGSGIGSGITRRAYLYGITLGKRFTDVNLKPAVSMKYDYTSGTSDSDVSAGRWGTFNQLFYTGHAFHGDMDVFLPVNGSGTAFLGLRDLVGKASIQPLESVTLGAAVHTFWTATNMNNNPNIRASLGIPTGSSAGTTSFLGNELDLTLTHKYSSNVTLMTGFSRFWASNLFQAISPLSGTQGTAAAVGSAPSNAQSANWGYVQMDVKF